MIHLRLFSSLLAATLLSFPALLQADTVPLVYSTPKGKTVTVEGADSEAILLWPGDPKLSAPDGLGIAHVTNRVRIHDITTPHLITYPAPASKQPTAAVILVPGGGYARLVSSKHWPFADFLLEQGIRPFILHYRCPSNKKKIGLLQDIQRAIRIVRSRAQEFNIDPDRLGLLGTSAGGHLSARANGSFATTSYEPRDQHDRVSAKPDFVCLLYPAYLKYEEKLHSSIQVSRDLSPTLILTAKDDHDYFPNSPFYEDKLKELGVDVQSHYFEEGRHGFFLGSRGVELLPELLTNWLKAQGAIR
ncbi:MAG: alpha/beta hydrolase [Opitutales bacterium]